MRHMVIAATLVAFIGGINIIGLTTGNHAIAGTVVDPEHAQGEKHKLGRKQIGNYTVSVIIVGEVEAGKHVDFDIKLIDAKSDPKALRVWVGTENASGSKKAEGKKGAVTYTGEVDVPNPLPQGSKLWVELETDDGLKRASYDYEQHDHKH